MEITIHNLNSNSFLLQHNDPTHVQAASFLMFLDHTQLETHKHTHTHTHAHPHTRQDSRPSQMLLPAQHTTDEHSGPQLDSNPRSQQSRGSRPAPQIARPPKFSVFMFLYSNFSIVLLCVTVLIRVPDNICKCSRNMQHILDSKLLSTSTFD